MPSKTTSKPGTKPPAKATSPAPKKAQKQSASTPPPGWKDPLAQQQPLVSGRWLASAILGVVGFAAVCAYLTLCLLFYQGQWQVVFHPSRTITATPATVGLKYDAISFDYTGTGAAQLTGWWIPAGPAQPPMPHVPCFFCTTAKARCPTLPHSSRHSIPSALTSSPLTIAASVRA